MSKPHIVWGSGRGRIRVGATVDNVTRMPDRQVLIGASVQYMQEWQEIYNRNGPAVHLGFLVRLEDLL